MMFKIMSKLVMSILNIKYGSSIKLFKIFTMLLLVIVSLTSCNALSSSRNNSWQKKYDFSKKRNPPFNTFVASGGMKKRKDMLTPGEYRIQSEINGVDVKAFNNRIPSDSINNNQMSSGIINDHSSVTSTGNCGKKIGISAVPGQKTVSVTTSDADGAQVPTSVGISPNSNGGNTVNLQTYVDTSKIPELK